MIAVLTLIPNTASPVIRDMHRQTREFEAASLAHARRMVRAAFPGGFDNGANWQVESVKAKPDV